MAADRNADILRTLLGMYDQRNDPRSLFGAHPGIMSIVADSMTQNVPVVEPLLSTEEIALIPFEVPFGAIQYVYSERLNAECQSVNRQRISSRMIDLQRRDDQSIVRNCCILTLDEFTEWFRQVDARIMRNPEASSMMLIEPRYASFEARRNIYYNHLFRRWAAYYSV